jgi:tetratricopeptide (TPR) repeat protein
MMRLVSPSAERAFGLALSAQPTLQRFFEKACLRDSLLVSVSCDHGKLWGALAIAAALLARYAHPRQFLSLLECSRSCLQTISNVRQTSAATLWQARAWYQAEMLAQSEALCTKILTVEPGHIDAIYLLGAVQNRSGRWQEALASFDRVLALKGDFPEALANRGVALGRLLRLDEAANSFVKALALRPDYAEACYNYGQTLFQMKRFADAAAQYEKALELKPDYIEALYSHGNVLRVMQRYREALASFQKLLAIKPNDADALNVCGLTLQHLKRFAEALSSFDRAITIKPDFVHALNNRGTALQELGRFEEALREFDKALSLRPDFAEARFNKGLLCLMLGRQEEARHAFETGIKLSPRKSDFYLGLTICKQFAADDPLISAMEDLARDETLNVEGRIKLGFALGKAFRDIGQFEPSFSQVLHASTLKRSHLDYNEGPVLALAELLPAIFSGTRIAEKSGKGHPSPLSVFVIGMPRSGTTLIEQILASHPQVFAAGEIDDFKRAIAETFGGFPETLENVSAERLLELGQRYVTNLRALAPEAERITDKSTQNWPFIGLIHLALPNTRIVHVHRDPVDTCLSSFFTLFAEGQVHTYDFAELGHYYRAYATLMAHWRAVLPAGVMLDVQYEELVADFENQARRIIAHCGLEWDDACFAFQKAKRAVKTASAFQVRQPLYSSSIGLWRRYLPLVQPLLDALGPELTPPLR